MKKILTLLLLGLAPHALAPSAFAGEARLKSCTFDVPFEYLEPTNAETRVAWIGLDLLTCDTATSNRVEKPDAAAGVYPGVSNDPWQVRVRQAYMGTNEGQVAQVLISKDGGKTFENPLFDSVSLVSDDLVFSPDKNYDYDSFFGPGGVDFYNPTLMKWGYYDLERHVFSPAQAVFVVHTKDGRYAKLQVLQYLFNGGGYEPDPKRPGRSVWNPNLGPADGKIHVVIRSVANLKPNDKQLQ